MKNIHYEVQIEGNRAIITKTIGDDITRYSTLELSPDEIEMWDNMTSDDIEYHLRTNDDYFKIN